MNKAYIGLALLTATSFLAASDASREPEQRLPLINTPPTSPSRLADSTDSSAPTSLAMLESRPQTSYRRNECSCFAPACGTYCSDCSVPCWLPLITGAGSCCIASLAGASIAGLHGYAWLTIAFEISAGIAGVSCWNAFSTCGEEERPDCLFIRQRLQEGQSPCSPVCERYIMTLWPTEPTSELE